MTEELKQKLFEMADADYKNFHKRLIPTVNPDRIIGIRTPVLRSFAREFSKTPEAEEFIKILPHNYYEEYNLHAFIIEAIRDYDRALYETERLLPYIDNWATCDMFMPKIFKKNTDKLLGKIREWLKSGETYTVRYGLGLLMGLYLDEKFSPELLELAAEVRSEEYYIKMMQAWYFATALAKQYDAALACITEKRLDDWVHNKTIQKAVESNRISPETKAYLKTLKIK